MSRCWREQEKDRERDREKDTERHRKTKRQERKGVEKMLEETYQNKLWPHGMRAALISPSKQTIQSRLEREVLFGLVAPFRLPKDPRDSVGELEVVVDPPEGPAEKAPKMVPLVEEENAEAES